MARKDNVYGKCPTENHSVIGFPYRWQPFSRAPRRAYNFRRVIWAAIANSCPPEYDPRPSEHGPRSAIQVDLYVDGVFIDFWRYHPPKISILLTWRSTTPYTICDDSAEEAQRAAALFWAWVERTMKARDELLQAARDAGTL